jgi:hypothetical protein
LPSGFQQLRQNLEKQQESKKWWQGAQAPMPTSELNLAAV